MRRISATTRLALSLTGLVVSVLLFGQLLGLFPDSVAMIRQSRTRMTESIAVAFAGHATVADDRAVRDMLEALVARNPDIRSIGVRQSGGDIVVATADHESVWDGELDAKSNDTAMQVPLGSPNGMWGSIEVMFQPIEESGASLLARVPPLVTTAGLGALVFLVYAVYLRFALRALNPSEAVPQRVTEALNTLAEGLLVLDKEQRIVLANKSFAEAAGISADDLLGKHVSDLPFRGHGNETDAEPWLRSMQDGTSEKGVLLDLDVTGDTRTYSVNSVPIFDERGAKRGVLASFEDVTDIERKNAELAETLVQLRRSARQVQRQNRELERLATRDPLTNCLNRRAFFEQAETIFRAALRYDYPISCLMLDVDHFKSVNDNHGHARGDEVLQQVALTLLKSARESSLVCRYGGEEFCVLLPHADLAAAYDFAERVRVNVEELRFEGLRVTASFGVTDLTLGEQDVQGMLDQADQALYAAKRTGRNRVIRFHEVEALNIDEEGTATTADEPVAMIPKEDPAAVPYHAVTALLSALAFRDRATAEHSRRVADLCVLLAEDLVPRRQCYVIEMAALLHDIGKVGVPDNVLLKPGTFTETEGLEMRKHELIGAEIIRASFASSELSRIVEHYYRANGTYNADTPLGARILMLADAYDAMTSNWLHRAGLSQEEAFLELRRCAGAQFDPELVELFISKISAQTASPTIQFGLSKQTALSIGLQMERLVAALDDRNLTLLTDLNRQLYQISVEHAVDTVSSKSMELSRKLADDEDLIDILYTARELLDACRATQSSFFEGSEFRKPVAEAKAELNQGRFI